jgi:protein-tyrosine phosphatase
MMVDRHLRHLKWDGCFNVRDLGGIPTVDGRQIRWGAVVRSERPYRLTAAGWSALWTHGIRTVIDLQDDGAREADASPRPVGIDTVFVPLEQGLADTDAEYRRWGESGILGTPLYFRDFIDRWPERCAAPVAAVARARPGGVLIHCGHGRDRTGLIVLVLLALAGAAPDDIVADYEESDSCLRPFCARLGHGDESVIIKGILARESTTTRAAIGDMLASLDLDAALRKGGLSEADLDAVRARLVEPSVA